MESNFFDTHCHVHFEAYKEDMDEVVKRSLDAGVGMITVGTQSSTSKNAIALAEKYDGVWATIGLHPNHVHKQAFFDDNELPAEQREVGKIKTRSEQFSDDVYAPLVSHPKVVAVGEFGLDYYRIPEHLEREQVIIDQKRECQKQLRFASTYEKPIVIHCRDAHTDQIELLRQEIQQGGLKKRGVIHSFTGTLIEAKGYEELGFYLGLNGILTFSKELQEVIKDVPLTQIVLETDAPYLTPPPNRGKRNEPLNVRDIAQFLADLKNVSLDEVQKITNLNAKTLFNI